MNHLEESILTPFLVFIVLPTSPISDFLFQSPKKAYKYVLITCKRTENCDYFVSRLFETIVASEPAEGGKLENQGTCTCSTCKKRANMSRC